MKSQSTVAIPWSSLSRLVGPLMIWLALSYLLAVYLLNTVWVQEALAEETRGDYFPLVASAMIFAVIGILLTIWGFSRKRIDYIPAKLSHGEIICPVCHAKLLESTLICPYCNARIQDSQKKLLKF